MDTSEKELEDIIVDHLRDINGYNQGNSSDLLDKIEQYEIYTQEEVDEINRIFFSEDDRAMLDPILDTAAERFNQLDDDGKIDCKSAIKGYNRIYPFLAAVIPHPTAYWEKMDTYLHLLAAKFPRTRV